MTCDYPAPCCCCCECCESLPLYLEVTLSGFSNGNCDDCLGINGTYILDQYGEEYPCRSWHANVSRGGPSCTGNPLMDLYVTIGGDGAGHCVLTAQLQSDTIVGCSGLCAWELEFNGARDCFNIGGVAADPDGSCTSDNADQCLCLYDGSSITVRGLDSLPS